MHRAPGSAVRCPAEGESATVKQKTEKSHSTVLLYQSSASLSTKKEPLDTLFGGGRVSREEGVEGYGESLDHSTALLYQPSTVMSIPKIGRLQGRTDGCRVGRTVADAIKNRAPGMAARCPIERSTVGDNHSSYIVAFDDRPVNHRHHRQIDRRSHHRQIDGRSGLCAHQILIAPVSSPFTQ